MASASIREPIVDRAATGWSGLSDFGGITGYGFGDVAEIRRSVGL